MNKHEGCWYPMRAQRHTFFLLTTRWETLNYFKQIKQMLALNNKKAKSNSASVLWSHITKIALIDTTNSYWGLSVNTISEEIWTTSLTATSNLPSSQEMKRKTVHAQLQTQRTVTQFQQYYMHPPWEIVIKHTAGQLSDRVKLGFANQAIQ